MSISRRSLLGGGIVATGTVLAGGLGATAGWGLKGSSTNQQLARQLVSQVQQHQRVDGSIKGDLYVSCQFAEAVKAVGWSPDRVQVAGGRSIGQLFASQARLDSQGAASLTDSISRLRAAHILGLDTQYRRGETLYLFERRLSRDEQGLVTGKDLAYLPYGLLALAEVGEKTNPLWSRAVSLLGQVRNPDGGYPEQVGGSSVGDLTAVVMQLKLHPSDGLTEEFLHSLRVDENGFAFRAGLASNVTTTALVHRALPGQFNILSHWSYLWEKSRKLDSNPDGDLRQLYNLCQAAIAFAS